MENKKMKATLMLLITFLFLNTGCDGQNKEETFHDVWKPEEKHFAQKYGIKLIPTQVFLDENGNEFHRHEGFYPEAEIDKILQGKGLKPVKIEG
jgi:thioredoxin-related protein